MPRSNDDIGTGTAPPAPDYLAGVAEMYQGEVFGEALFSRMAELARTAGQRYKLANLLQLESETKVRLRPFLCRLGLSVVENEAQRAAGLRQAEQLSAMPWAEFIEIFHADIHKYIARYAEIASLGPAADQETLVSMIDHERTLLSFLSRERAGMPDESLDAVLAQLRFPLIRAD